MTMSMVLTNRAIDKYFGFLVRLDNSSKKKLIIKLTESIEVVDEKKFDLKSLFGAWEDSRSSDEINTEIRNSRIDNNKLTDF